MKLVNHSAVKVDPPKLCVLPGEGAAAEAVLSSMKVLETLDLPIETDLLDVKTMSNEEMYRRMDNSQATLFGAMANGVNLLGYLRWTRGTYANIRPAKYRRNFHSPLKDPDGIDFVIVRENLEDLYPPREGNVSELEVLAKLHQEWDPLDGGIYALKVISEKNTRNVARYAAELAMQRREEGFKGLVTIGVKDNVLRRCDGLFRDVAMEVLKEYPDVKVEHASLMRCSTGWSQIPGPLMLCCCPTSTAISWLTEHPGSSEALAWRPAHVSAIIMRILSLSTGRRRTLRERGSLIPRRLCWRCPWRWIISAFQKLPENWRPRSRRRMFPEKRLRLTRAGEPEQMIFAERSLMRFE